MKGNSSDFSSPVPTLTGKDCFVLLEQFIPTCKKPSYYPVCSIVTELKVSNPCPGSLSIILNNMVYVQHNRFYSSTSEQALLYSHKVAYCFKDNCLWQL